MINEQMFLGALPVDGFGSSTDQEAQERYDIQKIRAEKALWIGGVAGTLGGAVIGGLMNRGEKSSQISFGAITGGISGLFLGLLPGIRITTRAENERVYFYQTGKLARAERGEPPVT